ncbi:sensor histidine kinase [Paenibacillus sp. GCM10028914]|uniref:sensor histidine kinase n=1 Tax=Paenibacillus sp. GCM10028914 TaxID=3273416 RepID=UPI0036D41D0A
MGSGSTIFQSFKYWFGRRSMQSRLVAAYIIILVIPSIAVSNYFFKQISDTYISDALNQNRFMLEMEKMTMLNQIEAMEMAAQLSISDQEINDYLTSEEDFGTKELLELARGPLQDLVGIQINNPNITHLRIFTHNDRVTEMWPIIFQEWRIAEEPWYPEVSQLNGSGGERWVFNYRDSDILRRYASNMNEDMPKVSLLRENYLGNRHVGIIQVEMLLKYFAPKTFAGIEDESSQMVIADRDGALFMDKNQPFLAHNEALRDAVASEFLEFKSQGSEQQETLHKQFKVNGKSFLLISTPVERLQSHLLNVVSLEGALNNVSKSQKQIIAVNIVLIVILAVTTYFMNSIILKNLRRLTETMKQVRKGEVRARIDIRGGGEIGELAHHFNKLIQTIHELIAQGIRKQALTKEAELRTLHSQIDSHFLYNTLENIKMLAEMEDQRTISDALTSLGGMMRYNFKWSGEYVKLKDEIRHIRNYIDVMNIRFEEPIELILNVPSEFLELEVLKMSLQPLVENAVKHAWPEQEVEQQVIRIDVISWEDDQITIAVTDNGIGIGDYRLRRLNEAIPLADKELVGGPEGYGRGGQQAGGIGLRNVHQRIRLFYGKEYGLEIKSEEGVFTTVVMFFPKVLLSGGGNLT